MQNLAVDTMAHAEVDADERLAQSLGEHFRGTLLRPGDAEYDAARRIWNGMIDKYPRMIARCSGTADVVDAVTFARASMSC